MNKENNNIIKIIVGVVAVVAVVVIGVGVFLLPKSNKTNKVEEGNKVEDKKTSETEENSKTDSGARAVMYINDYKIVLGETKISDIIANSKLTVVCNKVIEFGKSDTEEGKKYDYYKLTDGVNTIHVASYPNKLSVVNYISTLVNNRVDDPAFDTSTGTKISVDDVNFRKGIKIGDTLKEEDSLDSYYTDYNNIFNTLYSRLPDDKGKILYQQDKSDVILNISANADGSVNSGFNCSNE